MKTALAVSILITILNFKLYSCVTSHESEVEEFKYIASPIALTDQNFTEALKNDNYLVMFYWPKIEISDEMLHTVNLLSEIYNVGSNTNLKIASVDCEENNQTCVDNGIVGEHVENIFESFVLKLFKINVIKAITYTEDDTYIHYVLEFIKDHLNFPESDNSGVVELTDQNFKDLTSNGSWFVDFYFPWCIHAKNLEPTWNKLPSVLEQNSSVRIGKIDCVEYQKTTCKKYMIRNSPTILWLENGNIIDRYQGQRSVKLFKDYIES
ncbi:hypothetical protein ACKWTF_005452 [Chironomus riparius]